MPEACGRWLTLVVLAAASVAVMPREAAAIVAVVPFAGDLLSDDTLSFAPAPTESILVNAEAGNDVTGEIRYDTNTSPVVINPQLTRFDVNMTDAMTFSVNDFHLAVDQMTITRFRPGNGTDQYTFRFPPSPVVPPGSPMAARVEGGFTIPANQVFLEVLILVDEGPGDQLPAVWPLPSFINGHVTLRDAPGNELSADLQAIPEPGTAMVLALGVVAMRRRRVRIADDAA